MTIERKNGLAFEIKTYFECEVNWIEECFSHESESTCLFAFDSSVKRLEAEDADDTTAFFFATENTLWRGKSYSERVGELIIEIRLPEGSEWKAAFVRFGRYTGRVMFLKKTKGEL